MGNGMGNASSAQGCIAYAAIIQQSPSPAVSVSTQSPDETPLATWFHVTMTWDGEELRYYQNGSIVAILVDPSFVINQVGNSGILLACPRRRTDIGVLWTAIWMTLDFGTVPSRNVKLLPCTQLNLIQLFQYPQAQTFPSAQEIRLS